MPSEEKNRFVPLRLESQGSSTEVLYYDRLASLEALYETSLKRLNAACGLMSILKHVNLADQLALTSISSASTILLNDAMSMVKEIYLKSQHN